MIGYVQPKIAFATVERVGVIVPLNRRTKNQAGSMYFGAFMTRLDIAGGYILGKMIIEKPHSIYFAFRSASVQFHRRRPLIVKIRCLLKVLDVNTIELPGYWATQAWDDSHLDGRKSCKGPDFFRFLVSKIWHASCLRVLSSEHSRRS